MKERTLVTILFIAYLLLNSIFFGMVFSHTQDFWYQQIGLTAGALSNLVAIAILVIVARSKK